MLRISNTVAIEEDEVELTPIRAQGPGGQNVNKVSSAIHLRFNIPASTLPDEYKQRLLAFQDQRITRQGDIIIKAQQYRTQERNREDAFQRLVTLIREANVRQKTRHKTKPTRASKKRRLDTKNRRGKTKNLRGRVDPSSS